MLEGGALQLPDPLPVDAPVGVEGPPLGGEGGEVDPAGTGLGVASLAGAGHLFDPEVERVPEAAARRVVRAGLGEVGNGGVQGVQQARPGPDAARPRRQPAEVGEVADPP